MREEGLRSTLGERLESRRAEIEAAVSNRVFSVADPAEIGDPGYTAGLREAVTVGIEFALHSIFYTKVVDAPIPPALFVQAREAARNGVSLDTILRRYAAGHTVLGDFILQEAEENLSGEDLRRVCGAQAALFDRVLEAITEEYKRHAEPRSPSLERVKAERVKSLLAGELLDHAELGYEIESRNHLAAIAKGPDVRAALRELATRLDCRLLMVEEDACTWAWFGAERELRSQMALSLANSLWPAGLALALGEGSKGIEGWRLTHRQAKAAIAVSVRGPRNVVCYADVALLCAALGDEILATSLREAYLRPLEDDRDGGEALRETLRAYFASERNVSSTAAVLGVNRSTVISRLQAVAEHINRPVTECSAGLEVALQLDQLSPGQNKLLAHESLLPTH